MPDDFKLQALCIHLIDPEQAGASLSDGPLPVSQLREELSDFVQRHLGHLLGGTETRRTRAAQIYADSRVPGWRERALADDDSCFAVSSEMADALHEETPSTASTGLLAVTVFHDVETERQYFAAFKFRSSQSYKIQLASSVDGFSLDVRELDNCLPEPDEQRLYKAALIPHPQRTDAALKVHDDQTRAEPAQYFTRFLGCSLLETGKAQVRGVFDALESYAGREHEEPVPFTFNQDMLDKVPDLFDRLMAERESVTYETLVDAVEEAGVFEDFSPSDFAAELQRTPAAALQAQPQSFEEARMRYVLPSGITIAGPAQTVMREVLLDETREGVEFRIRSGRDFETECS